MNFGNLELFILHSKILKTPLNVVKIKWLKEQLKPRQRRNRLFLRIWMNMESFVSGVGLAVFLGLAVGKFIGVFTFSWLAIKLRLARKPVGCTWNAFASVCMLSGIGFTVALFISDLSFGGGNAGTATILNDAKIGIMAGSVISGIIGYVMLDKNLPHKKMYT